MASKRVTVGPPTCSQPYASVSPFGSLLPLPSSVTSCCSSTLRSAPASATGGSSHEAKTSAHRAHPGHDGVQRIVRPKLTPAQEQGARVERRVPGSGDAPIDVKRGPPPRKRGKKEMASAIDVVGKDIPSAGTALTQGEVGPYDDDIVRFECRLRRRRASRTGMTFTTGMPGSRVSAAARPHLRHRT